MWQWRSWRWQWRQLGGSDNSCLVVWRQRVGTGGNLAAAAATEALRCQLGTVVAEAAAAWLQRQLNGGGNGGWTTAQQRWRRWRRQLGCGSLVAALWRRQLGGGGGSMATAARRRWRK
jgi:hypothetical protein